LLHFPLKEKSILIPRQRNGMLKAKTLLGEFPQIAVFIYFYFLSFCGALRELGSFADVE
jgi:hypothetical protein